MEKERAEMVRFQIADRGITDPLVLEALRAVPRHEFLPTLQQHRAYEDGPVSIGKGQTISQPYIVALMTELAEVDADSVVFEVGTGSGYQAAVLGEIVKEVYTVEYIEALGLQAKERLAALGYKNVHVRVGDGYAGWPEHAPFDAILVTAGIDHVPQPLIEQLKAGGRMVIPVGADGNTQELLVIEKNADGRVKETKTIPVRFVPFLGPKRVESD
ncbi:MAG: protein-L-isoaspartate(D-aspartate) O-methyltransferase [Alphaproteobacteria bacterium]|nr:protein-L-isoaspartate(D-aspartate) O-methyltransferase [Alphaproteobacteria bacterium]MBP7759861.1 protein-L-isoaspartate(D-aspartate) O-methyltransferase [Alphaproteobacteria bacterium]MBP7763181.1 protein-L-isoaspartate(D-aspartate) O-methyltransferase [Alphaproteobacteria bacterium]MBP7904741.1 protein-L-isoaspartate(D-aspartate) O-methyltransferase [Alphaproteobacteria bacterium]